MFQNLLKHPDSRLVGVDPWLSYEHHRKGMDQEFADQCYENAQTNLNEWKSRVTLIRGMSQNVLPDGLIKGSVGPVLVGKFDLAIIDGDHKAAAVLTDAMNCFDLLKKGGWMLFDDVRTSIAKKGQVKEGLEEFLKSYDEQVKQVWSHRFCECYEKL